MTPFALGSLLGWVTVVLAAALFRGRGYAIFRGVGLGLHALIASTLVARFEGSLFWAFVGLHATVYLSSLVLVRPRLRPALYRALVSMPSAFFSAGTLLALPWAVAAWLGFTLPGVWLPYALALFGVIQSLTARTETLDIVVGERADGEDGVLSRAWRGAGGGARVARPLRLVQITDPHLGPFMSPARLRRICQRAVERDPDLVLLTGDFLTMESQASPELLAQALGPLAALPGRVFACLGNHDHEAPFTVRSALRAIGARLLVDEAETVVTQAGLVQVLGFDFVWRDRARHLARVLEEHPRVPGALRLALLHDPAAFRHLPPGATDLVLSGHTHGGQVGLLSLGLPFTMMRLFTPSPDHGLWTRGSDRLYVHRGTGHYGFPLRLGVPAEESLVAVHAAGE